MRIRRTGLLEMLSKARQTPTDVIGRLPNRVYPIWASNMPNSATAEFGDRPTHTVTVPRGSGYIENSGAQRDRLNLPIRIGMDRRVYSAPMTVVHV